MDETIACFVGSLVDPLMTSYFSEKLVMGLNLKVMIFLGR